MTGNVAVDTGDQDDFVSIGCVHLSIQGGPADAFCALDDGGDE